MCGPKKKKRMCGPIKMKHKNSAHSSETYIYTVSNQHDILERWTTAILL